MMENFEVFRYIQVWFFSRYKSNISSLEKIRKVEEQPKEGNKNDP